jgi:pimeloyl-ACP methyl ester carboxylesterase
MSYWVGRHGSSGGKETILFIHGAGGGEFTWSFQKGFFEKGYSPLILDLPGHGETGGTGEQDIPSYTEHVHDFMKTLGLPQAFLVGHSMGGAIVQTMALRHPEVMKGLVLVGTGARLKVLPSILEGIQKNFEETVANITHLAYSRKTSPELIATGVRQLKQCRPEVLYGDFLACDRFDVRNEVTSIDLPTLILCGDEDELTPVKYSEDLHARIKGSSLEIIPGSGHMVMMESPNALNGMIRAFIEGPNA